MTAKRERAEKAGRGGEEEAARWLESEGWEIIDRRRKTKLGEIDLIARREGLVAFVEVKWRRSVPDLDLAIDERRLARVAAAVIVCVRAVADLNISCPCGPGG